MPDSPDFSWVLDSAVAIANGVMTTVGLIAVTVMLGGVLSIVGALARRSRLSWCRAIAIFHVQLIRNTPFIVQLFIVFFGLPSFGLRLNAITAAIVAMTINMSAYGTEIVRAGLDSVAPGQGEAGRALGLRPRAVFQHIILPQALRATFPALASQVVITMLESAVVSQIAVRDLTYEADLIQSRTFRAFEAYLVVTAIYLALSVLLRRTLALAGQRGLGAGPG